MAAGEREGKAASGGDGISGEIRNSIGNSDAQFLEIVENFNHEIGTD